MRQAKYRFFLLPLFFVLACVGLYAQANSVITGVVTDQTGAVVSGANVTVTDPATGFKNTTVSGATGLFNIPGLNPGTYNMKVTAKGFQSFAQTSIPVIVSQTARVDVKLTVGAESETVTVEANALAVQADSNVVSSLISSEQISEIATENRNFAALAALGLGVSSALPDSNTPTSVAASFTISVNGLRQSHNIWLIDGGEADDRGGAGGMNIMPSQDAIAEFNMLTSNYPPDYGISSGATMSLSLKSGTQKFHGTGWEFNRATAYDANSYLNKTDSNKDNWTDRQAMHYNIYGFNIGGPLYIPKLYNTNKQKTFFFWNEEWRKINQGSTPSTVNALNSADKPTAGSAFTYTVPKYANSDASSGPVGGIVVPRADMVTDPAYQKKLTALGLTPGAAFPDNTIPASLIDSNAVTYLNTGIVPYAASGSTSDQISSQAQTPINVRDDILRVDHRINDKWQILGHYMHDSVTQNYGQPELGWLWASYNTVTSKLVNPSNSVAIKLTGIITPNLLVETSINYDGNTIDITDSSLALKPSSWSVTPFFNNGNTTLPGVYFGAPMSTAEQLSSNPWHNAAQDYMPKVDVSYTVGKHAMKFGASYNRYTKNQQLFGAFSGYYTFSGNSSGYQYSGNRVLSECQSASDYTGCYIGDGVVDMLLGLANSYNQFEKGYIRHYVNQTPSAYANDNWHVTPRLTLQIGLRYDALPHAWERNNDVSNFDQSSYLSVNSPQWNSDTSMNASGPGFSNPTNAATSFYLNGMQLAGQNGFPAGLVSNDYETIQPRFGFSEDLFGNGKTVLRGGLGTFFERMQGNDIYNAATNAPFAYSPTASQVYFSNPSTSLTTGETASTPTYPGGMTTLAKNYKAPAVAQFSFGVQHELAPSVVWVVQYVGNIAWHQNIDRPINNFPLNTDPAVRKAAGSLSSYTSTSGATVTLPTSGQGHVANNSASYRTYQGYGSITQQENSTNGNYNGFQTGVRLQNKWGLSGEVDYTWSHEIDITSYDLTTVSNPWSLKYDKSSGLLDRRSILNINYIYKLPLFNKDKGLIHTFAGGWELAGTAIFETGVPVPITYSNSDTIGLGGGYTNRPNVSGKMSYPKKFGEWFDTSKFTVPTAAWNGGSNLGFGSTRRDAVVGPGRVNFTTSLYKSFAIAERAHFELRFESFNTFNHTQFNGLNATGVTANNGSFGKVTSTWDPRMLELGGKFIF